MALRLLATRVIAPTVIRQSATLAVYRGYASKHKKNLFFFL